MRSLGQRKIRTDGDWSGSQPSAANCLMVSEVAPVGKVLTSYQLAPATMPTPKVVIPSSQPIANPRSMSRV